MSFILFNDDCLTRLKQLEENSVDSIVTDPPYGLSFMGKKWDYDVPSEEIWAECLRVLKPGGHLLAFAGTRTQHRMAVRIEDAGFEIRDLVMWHYGQGFPKSKNLGNGFGSALKPATEPITMARKPLDGTLEANYAKHGTGALNIDATRVGSEQVEAGRAGRGANGCGWGMQGQESGGVSIGRWPANLIHDGSDEVVGLFPADKQGSAARYFYCAKASKRDRDEGLDGFELKEGRPLGISNWEGQTNGSGKTMGPSAPRANVHPTVKPTDLMRYLCRLVTPPNGVVLDPFMGSGSTGKAAMLEGFQFIGIEREAEYVEIAKARIQHALDNQEKSEPDTQLGLDL